MRATIAPCSRSIGGGGRVRLSFSASSDDISLRVAGRVRSILDAAMGCSSSAWPRSRRWSKAFEPASELVTDAGRKLGTIYEVPVR